MVLGQYMEFLSLVTVMQHATKWVFLFFIAACHEIGQLTTFQIDFKTVPKLFILLDNFDSFVF